MSRVGPGLLLRDIQAGDPSLVALAEALALADADIVVLTQFDFDAGGNAADAFSNLVNADYAFTLPLRTNAGIPTGHDIDGDGRLNEPEDAQAFGRFPGQEALAVLSRYPIATDGLQSLNEVLWQDLPGHHAEVEDTGLDVQRLSSGGHWIVPIDIPNATGGVHQIKLLIGHAGAPVFDGPEDRNGRRNLDELRLWELILDGQFGPSVSRPFVFMANTNLDPERGEGHRLAMADFLSRADLTDPLPGQITAEWDRPGPMRVSYLLPSADLRIRGAQVWPALSDQRHRLITVDLTIPDTPLP